MKKIRMFLSIAMLAGLTLSIFFFTREAQGVQVKRVLRGEASFSTEESVKLVDLSAALGSELLDLTKTFVFIHPRIDGVYTSKDIFTANFDDNKTLLIQRGMDETAAVVSYTIVEFISGVKVIHGSTVINSTSYTKTTTLPEEVEADASFAIVTGTKIGYRLTGGHAVSHDQGATITGELNDSDTNDKYDQIIFKRDYLGQSGKEWVVAFDYQVVEFLSEANAQKGEIQLSTAPATVDLTSGGYHAVDPAKSFLVVHFRGGSGTGGNESAFFVRGEINAAGDTLTFTRASNTDTATVVWYLVEFDDVTFSQRGTASSSTNTATTGTFGSSVDATRTFEVFSVSSAGDRGDVSWSSTLTGTSGTFTRAVTGTAANIAWFATEMPPLKVTSPNGDEVWEVGNPYSDPDQKITWEHADALESGGSGTGGVHLLTIKLDKAGGTGGYPITVAANVLATDDAYPSSGSWSIPDTIDAQNPIGDTLKIRIIDDDPTAGLPATRNYDESNDVFAIEGYLALGEPNGPQDPVWKIGDTDKYITWTSHGQIGNIEIRYDVASGNSGIDGIPNSDDDYPILIDTVDASTASPYNWNPGGTGLPDVPYATLRIKIISLTYSSLVDYSEADFEIRPAIYIIEPDDTDQWMVGRINTIEWNATGSVPNVNVSYNAAGTGFVDLDDNPITGYQGVSPTPGYSYTCGAGNYCYDWTIDPDTTQAPNVKLRIEKSDNQEVFDEGPDDGDGFFSIISSVTLGDPPTSQILRVEQDTPVYWTHPGGLGNVGIKYTTQYSTGLNCQDEDTDNSSCWTTMGTPPNDAANLNPGVSGGSYTWKPPAGAISGDVGIRIFEEGANQNLVYDQKGSYTIKGRISVSDINEILHVGETKLIEWDAYGNIGNVYIDLSQNGQAGPFDVEILGPNVPYEDNGGCQKVNINASVEQFLWGSSAYYSDPACANPYTGIPDEIAESCSIKVYKIGEPDPTNGTAGVSNEFKLRGNILNVDVDEVEYNVTDTATISWTPVPSNYTATVTIEYSDGQNPPVAWTEIDESPVAASAGTCDWYITTQTPVSPTMKVRVYVDNAEDDPGDDSPFFAIKSTLLLTGEANGDGSPVWEIGTNKSITWNAIGDINPVDIYYTLTGVEPYDQPLVTDYPAGSGNQSYPMEPIPNDIIPNDMNTNIKFKVFRHGDSTIGGESQNTITIKKRFTGVSAPAVVRVDDHDIGLSNITWNTFGNIAPPSVPETQVYLNYDKNSGGGTDGNPGTPGDNYLFPINDGNPITDFGTGFVWDVDDAIGENVRIRVKSVTEQDDVYGDMGSDIVVKGNIDATYPTGTDVLTVGTGVPGGIQYAKHGTIGNLKIEYIYVPTGEATVISPEPAGAGGAGSMTWTPFAQDSFSNNVINQGASAQSRLRFTGLLHESNPVLKVEKLSPAFKIKGDISDIEPGDIANEPFPIATTTYIKWTTQGDVGDVRIKLDLLAGNSGADALPNTYDDYQITVTGPDTTYPNGNSVPYDHDGDYGSGPCPGYGVDCTGCWEWTIPESVSGQARIRVESIDNAVKDPATNMDTAGYSDFNFKIQGDIDLTTTPPNGPAPNYWKAGQTGKLIDWDPTPPGLGDVKIYLHYDDDGGPVYDNTLEITPAPLYSNGEKPVSWDIPDALSTEHAILEVIALADEDIKDESAAEFKIKPQFQVDEPNDINDQWEVHSADHPSLQDILWSNIKGTMDNVDIYISTNGGLGVDETPNTPDDYPDVTPPDLANKGGRIAQNQLAGTGLFDNWQVADIMTKQAKIRVYKYGDHETYADSGIFYIKGSIYNVNVKEDDAGSPGSPVVDLPINTLKHITWDSTGSLGTVNVSYATNADQPSPTWVPITAANNNGVSCQGIAVNSTSCAWTIPNDTSANVQVKVESVYSDDWVTVNGKSPGAPNFKSIIGSIEEVTVDADANGIDLIVGGNKTIRWKPNGNFGSGFNIKYRLCGSAQPCTWTPVPGASGISGDW
ncbi:hypothetical protein ACFL1D_05290, partial [Candidatus Omnitrophota bacterium]